MIDYGFKGKVAIVTGAGGGGFGPGICRLLAGEGAKVVASCRHLSEAEKVLEEVKSLGSQGLAVRTDVANAQECQDLVQQTMEAFGRVDILVTVPAWAAEKPFMQETYEDLHHTMDVTFWGAIYAVRAVLPNMIQQKSGSIVIISSESGKKPVPGTVMYGTAKAGLNFFAANLAKEIGPSGMRINVVSPGQSRTPKYLSSKWYSEEREKAMVKQFPLRRIGEIEDTVNAIAFLASDQASYITGEVLSVSGGV